jgi:S-adenosylmethionine:tRNA ribosyltransferase-isomerase
MTDFELKSYDFYLPPELIAERPVPDRHSSRLLVYDESKNQVFHSTYQNIGEFLPPESTLVFNRSKVFPCRLIGRKSTGGEVEVFLLSLLQTGRSFPAMIRASGKRRVGEIFEFTENFQAKINEVVGDGTFFVEFNCSYDHLIQKLNEIGKIPIPPYIRGGVSDEEDKRTYQTVYAKELGSVAAPTAGLHFSDELLEKLKTQGHHQASVTLHVGAGTFAPVKTTNILEHKMHEEFFTIDEENLQKIKKAKTRIAVGTTSLRTLESCWVNENIDFDPSQGMKGTSIFLYPGRPIKSISGLVTNFHLPQSTLLMLISALIGREKVLELYEIAIKEKYRFFSYGDGMLILRKP